MSRRIIHLAPYFDKQLFESAKILEIVTVPHRPVPVMKEILFFLFIMLFKIYIYSMSRKKENTYKRQFFLFDNWFHLMPGPCNHGNHIGIHIVYKYRFPPFPNSNIHRKHPSLFFNPLTIWTNGDNFIFLSLLFFILIFSIFLESLHLHFPFLHCWPGTKYPDQTHMHSEKYKCAAKKFH